MDSLLREKLTQLTSKCEVLQKNVFSINYQRVNTINASISWNKL